MNEYQNNHLLKENHKNSKENIKITEEKNMIQLISLEDIDKIDTIKQVQIQIQIKTIFTKKKEEVEAIALLLVEMIRILSHQKNIIIENFMEINLIMIVATVGKISDIINQ